MDVEEPGPAAPVLGDGRLGGTRDDMQCAEQAASAGVAAAEADRDVVADHLGVLQGTLGGGFFEPAADDGGHLGLISAEPLSCVRLGVTLF